MERSKLPLEWSKNLTLYEVNLRQFTDSGTLKEFENHLPRLKEMGIGILWLMPVQPIGKMNRKGSLGSYYSISDYTTINPEYGTWDDFVKLIEKAHQMGFFVILDWVANHTAWDHIWTQSHPEFYHKDKQGNFLAPCPDWQDVIHLNYEVEELREEMIRCMRHWLVEANIDGFRCDMAHLVPTSFWEEARTALEKESPVFMLAETENRDLIEEGFDALYAWKIFHTCDDIAKQRKTVSDLDKLFHSEIELFPDNRYQMLFTSNHDENSWNGSAIERLGFALEPMAVLTFTLPGIPLIYSGQEAACTKRLKFFEKDLIEWKDDKMASLYSLLIHLRKSTPALWSGRYGGEFVRIHTTRDHAILAFIRRKANNQVLVVLNLTGNAQSFGILGDEYADTYANVFTHEAVKLYPNHHFDFQPWEYKIFEL